MVENNLMEKITSLCKRRGFIYPASEIYGGFANTFDYGPLGAQMKKNIKDIWWSRFVIQRSDIVGLDSAIIQNPKTWEASGHLASFTDPMVECKSCHNRFRLDKLIEETSGASLEINFRNYIEDWWADLEKRTGDQQSQNDERSQLLAREAEKTKKELLDSGLTKKELDRD
jgi:glycyl-tRNA synthetase (class II)